MTLQAFFLIFLSVFLHAGWNFVSKSKRPSLAFYCLASATSSLVWLPWFLILRPDMTALSGMFWLMLLSSVLANVLYFFGLAHAYKSSGISSVYPMVRAIPVLLVAAVTLLLGMGTRPDAVALLGILPVFFGCLLIPLKSIREFRLKNYLQKSLIFVLIAAFGTTLYTLADSRGIHLMCEQLGLQSMHCSILYSAMQELSLFLIFLTVSMTNKEEHENFKAIFLKSYWPCLSGICASSAYILVLIAMMHVTNVCYIQAFRQMSLPIGVFLGIFFLKEDHGTAKMTGIFLVVLGLVLTAF